MPQSDDIPEPNAFDGASLAFVLRCRFERIVKGRGTVRPHFQLEEVGVGRIWRFSNLEQVLETLRGRIEPMFRDGGETS